MSFAPPVKTRVVDHTWNCSDDGDRNIDIISRIHEMRARPSPLTLGIVSTLYFPGPSPWSVTHYDLLSSLFIHPKVIAKHGATWMRSKAVCSPLIEPYTQSTPTHQAEKSINAPRIRLPIMMVNEVGRITPTYTVQHLALRCIGQSRER